ncbi:ABC transporter permease [Candidatus Pacearchaeota archaeon]|nr:ABC transporter permease [Candidatus Pacearchaeota archaeon]
MFLDYIHIAFKNLRRRGIRSWLTLLGIFIGIATVVSLISLGGGLRQAIVSQFGISSTEVIQVQAGGLNSFGPPGTSVTNPLTEGDVDAIERLGYVEAAIPRQIVTVKVEYNDFLEIGTATNIVDGKNRDLLYEILDIETVEGKLLDEGDNGKVVLGNNFYFEDKNSFKKEIRVGNSIIINERKFKVNGILKKKGSFIFDQIIILNDNDLRSISAYGDSVDLIAVKVKNKELVASAEKDIENLLRDRRKVKVGEEDFEVSTPQAALSTVDQVLTGIQIFVVMIAAISIVVGSLGIVNTMTTSVLERTKEIGIMKAIGAKNSDIFYQFFIEAGLLGLVGGTLGILFGIVIGYFGTFSINSFLGAATTPEISWTLITFTFLGSFIIGAISGIIPAIRAANQKPVEALRS